MTHTQTACLNRIALREDKKKGVSCWGCNPGPSVRKIGYEAQTKTKITKMQKRNTNSDIQR